MESRKPRLGLQASNSGRWLECTASPVFLLDNDHLVEDTSTVYADEGTLAHSHAADSLVLGFDRKDFGRNKAMADHIEDYVLYVQSKRKSGDKLLVEQDTDLFYMPDRRGFIDVNILYKKGFDITDLKYGAGVSVQAFENTQMMIYARSQIRRIELEAKRKFKKDEPVTMAIWQPRIFGEDSERKWTIPVSELLERTDEIGKTAKKIQEVANGKRDRSELVFAPGEKTCQFCDAKAFCGQYAGWVLGGLPVEPGRLLDGPKEGVELPVPDVLKLDQVAAILRSETAIKKYLEACRNYVFRKLRSGDSHPDWKIVTASSDRKWRDEVDAILFLEGKLPPEEIVIEQDPKTISPAQAEIALKRRAKKKSDPLWEGFRNLIVKEPGGPVLAPASDKRKPFEEERAEDHFEVEEPD